MEPVLQNHARKMVGHTIKRYIRAYKLMQFYIVQSAKKSYRIMYFRVKELRTLSLLELLFAFSHSHFLIFHIAVMDFFEFPFYNFAAIIVVYSMEIMIEWSD